MNLGKSPYNYDSWANVFYVDSNGGLGNNNLNWTDPGVRPAINLRSDVTISGGDGTSLNPYVVE